MVRDTSTERRRAPPPPAGQGRPLGVVRGALAARPAPAHNQQQENFSACLEQEDMWPYVRATLDTVALHLVCQRW